MAYNVAPKYQQTITMTVPFNNSYRHLDKIYKMDTIEVTVTGSIKKKTKISSTNKIKEVIQDHVINYFEGTIVQESKILELKDRTGKIIPVSKAPTLENLSVQVFKKLAPLMPKIGCQLISVQLVSENVKITHSRYKAINYRI